ncbi:type VI secretion system baseplate subunit TssG [Vibrio mediterranei]|uniref:type VI secretion system baseplate subunit TssG n=1 Tax=Vibrio mediterranei TaxID=689 RepID=UPI001EFD20DC|nr:type VI secretion system baseplate subunit TssG [Vibrio mediterranei]MCG9625120.1 type VI secretion system baseplate subunit TssG [Vibrio mediterranei]
MSLNLSSSPMNGLCNQPDDFEFAQAIRVLQSYCSDNPQNRTRLKLESEVIPSGDLSDVSQVEVTNRQIRLSIAKTALSGVYGVIPDYIYEELLEALHQEDEGLKAFLDVFNQRQFELTYKQETRAWLLLQNEQNNKLNTTLYHLSGLENSNRHLIQYTMLLGQNSRNLRTLEQLLNDYYELKISVQVTPYETRKLPEAATSNIGKSVKSRKNNKLGRGLLIGSCCDVPSASIKVYIEPQNRHEVEQLKRDSRLANDVKSTVQHYLKDDTPVTIYLLILRQHLNAPVLSSNALTSAKLGEVDCLAPERFPQSKVRIRLR